MMDMKRLAIPDVVEIIPARFGDARGWFSEVYSAARMTQAGLPTGWVQDNQSRSATPGTLRGLHLQAPPFAQDKLVRVLRGAIFDVAVDVRTGSPSFGKWVGVELSADRGNQLLVPIGFAHGFVTLTEDVEVLYKVSAPYSREHERAVRWDDPAIGIDWPLPGDPVLSDKDRAAPPLADLGPVFRFKEG